MDTGVDEPKKTTRLLEDISSKLEIILLIFKDFIDTFKVEQCQSSDVLLTQNKLHADCIFLLHITKIVQLRNF